MFLFLIGCSFEKPIKVLLHPDGIVEVTKEGEASAVLRYNAELKKWEKKAIKSNESGQAKNTP